MKISIIVFPGSNCNKDIENSVFHVTKKKPYMIWHRDNHIPKSDLIIIPGGFSYGDYLRSGAIAAKSQIIDEVIRQVKKGTYILGICNGFQILTEAKLLPGTLMMNNNLKFSCKLVNLCSYNYNSVFTKIYKNDEVFKLPIAHKMGNYQVNSEELKILKQENRIAFRYCNKKNEFNLDSNPNGSIFNIAGILGNNGRILGMMPHPERPYCNINNNNYFFKNLLNQFK